MAKLVILSGVAGSGKSTFIKNYKWGRPVIVLSTDAIRKKLTGDESCLERDKEVWKYIYDTLEKPTVQDAVYVVDATNLAIRRRKSYLQYKNRFESVELWYLSVDVDTALKRNAERSRHVPEDVIRSMHESAKTANLELEWLLHLGYDEVRVIANN